MPTIVNTWGGNNSDDFGGAGASDVWDSTLGAIRIYQSNDRIVTIVRGGHGTRFNQVYQTGTVQWRTSEGKFHGGGQAYEVKYEWKHAGGGGNSFTDSVTRDLFKTAQGNSTSFTTKKVVFHINRI